MTYKLSTNGIETQKRAKTFASLKKLLQILADERSNLILALTIILINSLLTLIAPFLIGHTIDTYIQTRQIHGVLVYSAILLGIYIVVLITGYLQTKLMGGVGQRMLFRLRNNIFVRLQKLPIAFFNENKAGDLISRINNDTDKLNQFFSQSLMQFIGSFFIMTGAGIFLLVINLPLGAAALVPAIFILLFSRSVTPLVKRRNAQNLASVGQMSAEIQESLNNFRVVVAFNRRDYFRKKFDEVNHQSYSTAIKAGLLNNLFMPVYSLFSNFGQLIVLAFGIFLVSKGDFTLGLLISFLAYIANFYNPLRQLAAIWTNFQVALAGWDRISEILNMETNLLPKQDRMESCETPQIVFRHVSFSYPNSKEVLHNVNFELEKGKTYAFVGPTGGGKTTTASLLARLYDPVHGRIYMNGKDLRSYTPDERASKIGFILQEPFLFTGTIKENIFYGNDSLETDSGEKLIAEIRQAGLENLLETRVSVSRESHGTP